MGLESGRQGDQWDECYMSPHKKRAVAARAIEKVLPLQYITMAPYSQRDALSQVRRRHNDNHSKHSKAAKSLHDALAVRNNKGTLARRLSRQEDAENYALFTQALTDAIDDLDDLEDDLEDEEDDDVQEPEMDIHETDFSYVVQADLPGVKKVSVLNCFPTHCICF
ncbi:hypothetical protein BC830DRAFT_887752, partial [Chytriomyces sp. MP71]